MLESFIGLKSIEKLSFILGCLGVLVSVAGVYISVLIFKKQAKTQKQMDDFVASALNQLKVYEQTGFDLLVALRNDNLRLFANQFDKEEKGYWHYKWRFETWDELGLIVHLSDTSECVVRVKILGTTEDFRKNTFDIKYNYYICEVIESNNVEVFPIKLKVACFIYNGTSYISKTVSTIGEHEEKYKFIIAGLGPIQVEWGSESPASGVILQARAKDYKI